MINPTGAQHQARSTGRTYRLLLADTGWGKTYTLAYDALWYAKYSNKQILVVTKDITAYNRALSEYCLQEHDTSEIVVSDKYLQGSWFMVQIDGYEHWPEAELRSLLAEVQSNLLWIAGSIPSKDHLIYDLLLKARKNRSDWWIKIGDKHESYTENFRSLQELPVTDYTSEDLV